LTAIFKEHDSLESEENPLLIIKICIVNKCESVKTEFMNNFKKRF